jgi:hypothetical protein
MRSRVKLQECSESARSIDSRGASGHEDRDPDRFRCFLRASSVAHRGVGMRGDASIAALADGYCERDQFLRFGIERTGVQRTVVQGRESLVHIGNRSTKIPGRPAQRLLHRASVSTMSRVVSHWTPPSMRGISPD